MLIDKLSEKEMQMIASLREDCINHETDFYNGRMVNTNYWLRFWEAAKEQNLARPFKDSLILERNITSIVPSDILFDKMYDIIAEKGDNNTEGSYYVKNTILEYLKQYNDIHAYKYGGGGEDLKSVVNYWLFSPDPFIYNSFNFDTIEVNIEGGKTMKLNRGAKVMKIIGKLAKLANCYDEFEAMRIKQSQVMNDARLQTTMCLSIHPLDYMTASYNNNNWRSCMRWGDGEYCRGVIEMMNSPLVVVAYLKSEHEVVSIGNDIWNSKKWREFFIVSDDMITGIKGYPYWSRELEDIALKWLKELYATPEHEYSNNIIVWGVGGNNQYSIIHDESVHAEMTVDFQCGPAMYNDFYGDNTYHSILAKGVKRSNIEIFYSGASECAICGKTCVDFDSEGNLYCNDCIEKHYCCSCGDTICYSNELITLDDREYCVYCYDSLDHCDICDIPVDPNNDNSYSFVIETEDNKIVASDEENEQKFCMCCQCFEDSLAENVSCNDVNIDSWHWPRQRCGAWTTEPIVSILNFKKEYRKLLMPTYPDIPYQIEKDLY